MKPMAIGNVCNVYPKIIKGMLWVNDGPINSAKVYINGFEVSDNDIEVLKEVGCIRIKPELLGTGNITCDISQGNADEQWFGAYKQNEHDLGNIERSSK